jgi:hypothetical protein
MVDGSPTFVGEREREWVGILGCDSGVVGERRGRVMLKYPHWALLLLPFPLPELSSYHIEGPSDKLSPLGPERQMGIRFFSPDLILIVTG